MSVIFLRTTILIFLTFCSQLSAQESSKHIYLGFGGGPGAPSASVGASLTGINEEGYGLTFNIKPYHFEAVNLPPDYRSGFCIDLFPGKNSDCKPNDRALTYNLGFLKEFNTNTIFVRYAFEAGPSLIRYAKKSFTPKTKTILSSNYDVRESADHYIGLYVRAKFEFPFTKVFGMELAGVAIINSVKPFYGVDCFINLGYLRERIEKTQE